jgi:hypothetical protein
MSDFSNLAESSGFFDEMELDTGVDFVNIGDEGVLVISSGGGFGEGGFGEGPFGGAVDSIVINLPGTVWTNIDTP